MPTSRALQSSSGAVRSAYVGVTIAPLDTSEPRGRASGVGFVDGGDEPDPPHAAAMAAIRVTERTARGMWK